MWAFVQVARIEQAWGGWRALVTLVDDGVEESFFILNSRTPLFLESAETAAAALVAHLNSEGSLAELARMVESDAWDNLKYQTKAQLADLFRARYQLATKLEAAKMATWLLNRIADGTFTDAQVRGAFGLTTTQYNNLKTRMTTLRDNWLAVNAAVGE